MPKLIIDDREIEVPVGTKVIEAAERLGIMIPRFCYHEALGAVGACRMCAVKFVHGPFKGIQMSCMIEAQDGMAVTTNDEESTAFRKQVVEWLMVNHPHDCPVCDEGGQCLLQDETVSGGHGVRRYFGPKRTYRDQYLGPLVAHEMNRCIHCYRCSRFYQQFAGYRDLGTMQIAERVYFGRFSDGRLESPFSGNLVDLCPTGVYTDKPSRYKARRWGLQRSPSLCVHCSLGCNITANSYHREVVRVESRVNRDVNGFFICDRGRHGFGYVNHPDRPRRALIDGKEAPFDEAVAAATGKLAEISARTGSKSIALTGLTRCSFETLAVMKRLCAEQGWTPPAIFPEGLAALKVHRAVSRLDDRTVVSLREIERADFVLVVGADPINEAPMLALALRQAHRGGAPILMIDPRPIFAPYEFEHMAVAPGEFDEYLGMLIREVSEKEEGSPEAHARDLPGGQSQPRKFDPDVRERLADAARRLRRSRNPVVVCGTDVVRETTPDAAADLALSLRGPTGRCGLFYTMPGPNAFGAALLSEPGGPTHADVVRAIEEDKIKALVAVQSDLFFTFPDRTRLEAALDRLELLVVLDFLPSEIGRRANILLPTTTIFERGETFINQEGRIQYAEPTHPGGTPIRIVAAGGRPSRVFCSGAPGADPEPAWMTLAQIAGQGSQLSEIVRNTPTDFFTKELSALCEARVSYPVDGARVSLRNGDSSPRSHGGEGPSVEIPSNALEVLMTDRTFGTEELSAWSEIIHELEERPSALMNSDDAAAAGVADGDTIALRFNEGTLEARLRASSTAARGVLVLPRSRRLDRRRMPTTVPGFLTIDRIRRVSSEPADAGVGN